MYKQFSQDTPYCGVNPYIIQVAKPILDETNFEMLFKFIVERYKIHLKKDVWNQEPPWTNDKILRDYRFTNVRREHDKETKWVINNIVFNKALSYRDKILNIIAFRLFNKHETFEIFGALNFDKDFDPEAYRRLFKEKSKKCPGYVFFTNAFFTSGMKRCIDKGISEEYVPVRVLKFVKKLADSKIFTRIRNSKNQKEVFEVLTSYEGLGSFIAYQMFIDFTYIPEFPFTEDEFTVVGPGCKKGLNYVFKSLGGMTYEEALFWLRDNIETEFFKRDFDWNPDALYQDIPDNSRYLSLMSLENCHCELAKYIAVLNRTGRPRNLYKRST